METIKIAGLNIPVFSGKGFVKSSDLVETPTTQKNLEKILNPLMEKYPLLLTGAAGTGKNEYIYYINYKRNI